MALQSAIESAYSMAKCSAYAYQTCTFQFPIHQKYGQ